MNLRQLILRNLAHYRATNLAVMAGVATAVAVLSGALLVGQSVRDSLRSLLYQRIGTTEYVVSADRFFREALAGELAARAATDTSTPSCPVIYLQGVLVHEATGRRAVDVNVYGIDQRFWRLQDAADLKAPEGRTALVGAPLAEKLGATSGDTLLLRIETQQGIPKESLYGRREELGRTVRLVCGDILPADRLGEFALGPSQGTVYSVFVPLQRLQRDLSQPSRANAILLAPRSPDGGVEQIRDELKKGFTLQDLGVQLRPLQSPPGLSVESTRMILDETVAEAAFTAARDAGLQASGVFTYLANAIRARGREIPYSVVTAVDLGRGTMAGVLPTESSSVLPPSGEAEHRIWLNEWARRDLGIAPGDEVELDYFAWQEEGSLVTRTARFRFAGAVPMGGGVDPSLAPDYPGITDAKSMASWDPPFPVDLHLIRPRDEDYWNLYRTTPKAFVTLLTGQGLWQNRFGELTAVRILVPKGTDLESARAGIAAGLRGRIDPEQAGFSVTAVRERGLTASRGSTDFGEYFVYFSLFLIAAAIMLSALFFRLGVEQRVREIGTLQALGFPLRTLRRIFLLEGTLLSVCGTFFGLLGSIGYGWLMLFGLRTWWVGAVGTRHLYLHVAWADLGAGAAGGLLASLATIVWTLRGLQRNSPRALLAGILESPAQGSRRTRALRFLTMIAFAAAAFMILGSASGRVPDVEGFFGGGFLLLIAILSSTALYLRRTGPGLIGGQGWPAFFRLGARNAMHRPGRSLLCVALIASATFIIVSVEAFRRDSQSESLEPRSGTGGYALVGRSALPVIYDPNSTAGREALGIPEDVAPDLARVEFVPFRLRPGDDTSCLNLYAPLEPRILGAPHSFLAAGRFSFQDSIPGGGENPWLLLESEFQDGTVPAIADANTIQYILHLSIGGELTVHQSHGSPVRLRLVAALRDSLFQGTLLISDTNFLRLFPEQEGFRFFLIDAPGGGSAPLVPLLEDRLADWGFSAEPTRAVLAAYHRVENTYLSTFQSLGALGLILGTVGIATVLLRNVLERRAELALLRAVGYRRRVLSGIIVAENLVLLLWGLACGTVCAVLAILPALHARGMPFPALMVFVILSAVLAAGLGSSLLAVRAAARFPLLEALRSE